MIRSVVVTLLLFIGACSCEKKDCDFDGRYRFKLPVTLSPVQDTFRTGDTILVNSSFSKEVFEVKTSRNYILEDFKFYPTVAINRLDTNTVDHNASRFFEPHADEGVDFGAYIFNSGSHRFLGEYSYTNETYNLKFSLVPQRPGLYLLDITSFLYPQSENQDFEGKCRNMSSEAYMILNEADPYINNYHLLTNAQDTSFANEVLKENALQGSFLFYVR